MEKALEVEIKEMLPPVEVYQNLRKSAGWYCADDERTERGLENSLYSVCAILENEIIGCGRIVGDGHVYFYLQDIIVLPQYQKRGIGFEITQKLMDFIRRNAPTNSFIGLMAAEGVSDFYEKFGFQKRSDGAPGMFLVKEGIL